MKSHFLKKLLSLVLTFVILVCSITSNVSAAVIELNYWYCDTQYENSYMYIGYWNTFPYNVYVYSYSDMYSSFGSAMRESITRWNRALSISMSYSSNTSQTQTTTYNIKYFGGTVNEIQNLGFWNNDNINWSYTVGYSPMNWYTNTLNSYTYGTYENIKKMNISSVTGFIININSLPNIPNPGINEYAAYSNLCTHELGHALGWYGHNNHTGHVMYHNNETGYGTLYTLSSEDINHIKQLYD